MATNIKDTTIADTYKFLLKRDSSTYYQPGMNIELQNDTGVALATGLFLESGATTDHVGIGTSAPARELVVYGSSPVIQLANATTVVGSGDGLKIQLTSDDVSIINQEPNGHMYFGVNDSTDMTILDGGNVGIATTSPPGLLSLKNTGDMFWECGSSNSNDRAWQLKQDQSSLGFLSIRSSDANDNTIDREVMTFDRSGNVGISVTDPDVILEIKGAANNGLKITDSSGNDNVFLRSNGGQTGGELQCLDTAGVANVALSSSGTSIFMHALGVGTSPSFKLDVAASHANANTRALNVSNVYASGTVHGGIVQASGAATLNIGLQGEGTNGTYNIGLKSQCVTGANNTSLVVSMTGGGGKLVSWETNGSENGTVIELGGTVTYNPFFASHYTELSDGTDQSSLLAGTVLESTSAIVENKFTSDKRLPKCKVSAVADSPAVYGVYFSDVLNEDEVPAREAVKAVAAVAGAGAKDAVLDADGKVIEAAVEAVGAVEAVEAATAVKGVPATIAGLNSGGLGAYFVRIHKDIDVAIGDLLVSNGDGTAKKQDDDIIRSKTIGKVTSTTKKETYVDGSYIVPCVLYCG